MFGLKRLRYILGEARPTSLSFFHELIGKATVAWALLEVALDLSNELIMLHDGGEVIQKDLPASLNRKVAFFRKAHREIPRLQRYAPRAEAIADEIVRLKEKRHDLIHGYASSNPPDGVREIVRLRYDGQTLKPQSATYSPRDLMLLSVEITTVARAVCVLSADVWPLHAAIYSGNDKSR